MILEKYRSLNDENNNDDGKYKMCIIIILIQVNNIFIFPLMFYFQDDEYSNSLQQDQISKEKKENKPEVILNSDFINFICKIKININF